MLAARWGCNRSHCKPYYRGKEDYPRGSKAYSFTSKPIAKALMEAHKRGVDVQVVLDKSNLSAKYNSATFLANVGVPVRINFRYAIMHNKYILVDGMTVQTGSFNYSSAAESKNAENVLVVRGNQKLAETYQKTGKSYGMNLKPIRLDTNMKNAICTIIKPSEFNTISLQPVGGMFWGDTQYNI